MALGSRCWNASSTGVPREFIYVKAGSEGLTVGQAALWNAAYETRLLDQNGSATDTGPIGLAMCTVAAASYGWLQIAGPGVAACEAEITTAPVYTSANAGKLDDTAADAKQVIRMRFTAEEPASEGDGFVAVEMHYPWAGTYDSHG